MRKFNHLVFGLGLLLMVLPAAAQRGGQGRGGAPQDRPAALSPEQLERAWTLEAHCFAAGVELDEQQTEKLTETYMQTRQRLAKAMRDAVGRRGGPGEGGGGRGGRGGDAGGAGEAGDDDARPNMRELVQQEREKLGEALQDMLDEEAHERAMKTLGSFNMTWDRMVLAINGFELGEDETMAALRPVEDYVATITDLRTSGDRDGMRQGIRDARQKLMDEMGEILTEDQLAEFRQSVNAGRGGPGGRGMPGGQGGRGGGGGGQR